MNWIKKNPFLAALAITSALIAVAGGSMLFSEMARAAEEKEVFDQKSRQIEALRRHKPYPNQANVEASEREATDARQVLEELAKAFSVQLPSASPQSFQDELAKLAKDTLEKAAAKNISMPENFFLGFERYETQLPSPEAAPRLTLQLRTVHAVVAVLIDSQVQAIGNILRAPLNGEVPAEDSLPDARAGKNSPAIVGGAFEIAPFDISFVSAQSAFRTAFNRLLDLQPPVFLRLVAVENSALAPPFKKPAAAEEASGTVEAPAAPGIRAVVGRETITASLQLSSVVSSEQASP